jgi:hypothetical protein
MVPCLRWDGVWIPAFAGMTAFAMINVAVYKSQIINLQSPISNPQLEEKFPNFKHSIGNAHDDENAQERADHQEERPFNLSFFKEETDDAC